MCAKHTECLSLNFYVSKNRRWECLEVTYRVLQPQSVFLCVNWGKSLAQPPITDEALESLKSSGKHFFKLLVHWFSFLLQILWQFLRSPSPPPFVMHVLSNATKIHKSLFSLYAAIRFFRHHGLPRVRMHKFIVNYHLFSCERFFCVSHCTPRVPLCSKNLSCIQFVWNTTSLMTAWICSKFSA